MPLTCSRLIADYIREKCTFSRNNASILRFLTPFGGLQATYAVHPRLVGKRVVEFLLVIVKLCSVGVTAAALRAKTNKKSAFLQGRGQLGPKFQVQGVVPTNHFFCHKTGMIDLSFVA